MTYREIAVGGEMRDRGMTACETHGEGKMTDCGMTAHETHGGEMTDCEKTLSIKQK